MIQRIEAHLQSLELYIVTANMRGETAEKVAGYVLEHKDISGFRGPTISKVYSDDGQNWFAVTVIVKQGNLLEVVERFRQIGGSSVTVSQPNYVFNSESNAIARLTNAS